MDRIARIELPKDLASCPATPAIGVHDNLPAHTLVDIAAKHPNIWHLVRTGTAHFKEEVASSELMIASPQKYLDFPISSILCPATAGQISEKAHLVLSRPFRRASEKRDVLESFKTQVQKFKFSSTLVMELVLIADEMFTNAIFNAPHVEFGKNGPGAERSKENGELELRPARLFMGTDNNRVVVGCEDSYGSLNPARLLERLNTCFVQGAYASINWGGGGAGIGTFIIFRSALSFYAGVAHGKKTVVACTFPNQRQTFNPVQNLHFWTDAGSKAEVKANGR
jgi:hypothetical protein